MCILKNDLMLNSLGFSPGESDLSMQIYRASKEKDSPQGRLF